MDISGKNIIVTGGISGIGHQVVLDLIREGAHLCVLDVNTEGLEAFSRQHPDVATRTCDLTSAPDVESCIEAIFAKWQRIDVLINCAGILHSAPLLSFSPTGISKHSVADWKMVLETNLSSIFYTSRCVAEKMLLKRTRGVIINISSISARGNAGQSAYSAAKAGVNALTATWSKELGMFGIRTVGIAPGFINTESTHRALKDGMIKDIAEKIPLLRLGEAHEISLGVVSVIKNEFINGKIIEIDGGLTI